MAGDGGGVREGGGGAGRERFCGRLCLCPLSMGGQYLNFNPKPSMRGQYLNSNPKPGILCLWEVSTERLGFRV